MPRDELPAMITKLRAQPDLAARALEFLILTAGRDSEVTGALWSEIDFITRTWTIPGERMKAGKQHIVPLSDRAVELLKALLPRTGERIFPGVSRLGMRLVRLIGDAYTVHGFRSTFRDWAGDCTHHDRMLAEDALAHQLGAVEGAYRRGTAIERRRVLMQDWAAFCAGETATVIPLRAIA
jgi:integrase